MRFIQSPYVAAECSVYLNLSLKQALSKPGIFSFVIFLRFSQYQLPASQLIPGIPSGLDFLSTLSTFIYINYYSLVLWFYGFAFLSHLLASFWPFHSESMWNLVNNILHMKWTSCAFLINSKSKKPILFSAKKIKIHGKSMVNLTQTIIQKQYNRNCYIKIKLFKSSQNAK